MCNKKCIMCEVGILKRITTESMLRNYPHFYGLGALKITSEEQTCSIDENVEPLKISVWRCGDCGYLHFFDANFD